MTQPTSKETTRKKREGTKASPTENVRALSDDVDVPTLAKLAGQSGSKEAVEAFAQLWIQAAAQIRVARHAAIGAATTVTPEQTRAHESMLALAVTLGIVDAWFHARSVMLGQLLNRLNTGEPFNVH